MSDDEDHEFFTDPNGPAYTAEEVRTGPPLDYVAEKLANSLKSLHSLLDAIEQRVPENIPALWKGQGDPPPLKETYLLRPAQYAFHYGLVAYLALRNLLALANDLHLVERLAQLSDDEFAEWLNRIREEGSVTG